MLPETSELAELWSFIVEKAPDEMPARRAKIYRGTALVIGNELDAKNLLGLAARCDALDRDCRQLSLNFGREGNGDGGAPKS